MQLTCNIAFCKPVNFNVFTYQSVNRNYQRDNFDTEKVVSYFLEGKLEKWLEDRYYEDELEAVAELKKDDEELVKKICKIFDVEYSEDDLSVEEIAIRNARISKLKQLTSDDKIIENIDIVAFNQEELADLYDNGVEKIYLCEGEFNIPKSKNNLEYEVICNATVEGLKKKEEPKEEKMKDDKHSEVSYPIEDDISDADYIFDRLADRIGMNNYVIGDGYVAFEDSRGSFKDGLKSLVEYGSFGIWDNKSEKLSYFKLTGYDEYRKLVAATGSKVILKNYSNDLLIYNLEDKNIKLFSKNLYGYSELPISVCNGKIAYIDKEKQLYYMDLNSYEEKFVRKIEEINSILLTENYLFYIDKGSRNGNSLYQYNLSNRLRIPLGKIDANIDVEEIMEYDNKIYLICKNFGRGEFFIYELNLNLQNKTLNLVFRTEIGKTECLRKEHYYVLLKEESGYPVYAFNAKTGAVKKVLSNCGYTESESHIFKDTDYYHYGYNFNIVGDYLFYDKSKRFAESNYYRLNMITGEQIAENKKNK